jgi:hypothetical protein
MCYYLHECNRIIKYNIMNTISKLVYVSYCLESTYQNYQFNNVNIIVSVENLRTLQPVVSALLYFRITAV